MSRVLVLAVLLSLVHVARAEDKAECYYVEIAATSGKQPSIDPDLKVLEKKLKKPPFSSWNVFHKLSAGAFALQKQKAELPHLQQGAASILLRDRSEKRLDLTITVDGPDGKRVIDTKLGLAVGDWLPLVNNVKDDGHILALTCK